MSAEDFSISVDGIGLVADEFEALPDVGQRALVRALNRGATAGRTFLVSAVAKDIGIKASVTSKAIKSKRATLRNPRAEISAGLVRIPVIDLNARDLGGRGRRRKGVGGVVFSSGGGAQSRIPNAFIRRMSNGHLGVFQRVGVSERRGNRAWSLNLPIEEKAGPSIGRVVLKYEPAAKVRALEVMLTTVEREIAYRKSKAGNA